MGYSFIHQYLKEEGLEDFVEIANYLENGLMQRMTEEDEEDHDDAEAIAVEPPKTAVVEETMNGLVIMTKEIIDRMQ
eukprot:11496157-Heterocapsa_arctica.AAC.1